jgi:hypothetical protein
MTACRSILGCAFPPLETYGADYHPRRRRRVDAVSQPPKPRTDTLRATSDKKGDDGLIPELVGGALDMLPAGGLLAVMGERATRAVQMEWPRNSSLIRRLATARARIGREDLTDMVERDPLGGSTARSHNVCRWNERTGQDSAHLGRFSGRPWRIPRKSTTYP